MATYTTTYKEAVRSNRLETPDLTSPFNWLRDGWRDFTGAPLISLMLGGAFTFICAAAYAAATHLPMFSVSLLTFVLFVGPYVATMAYAVARQREQHKIPSLQSSFRDVRSRALSIGLFSILCTLIVAAWVRLSSIAFALYYGTRGEGAAEIARAWTAGVNIPDMAFFVGITTAALALFLFAIGAVALPLIADSNRNVITAVKCSLDTMRKYPSTMLVWLLLLTALIAVALLSLLVLMPIVFPVLAYATWHSYRELSGSG